MYQFVPSHFVDRKKYLQTSARWTIYGPIRRLTVYIFKGVVEIFLQSIRNSLFVNNI